MGGTSDASTVIQIADDCPAQMAQEPPVGSKAPTVAELQYRLVAENSCEFVSDDVLLTVYAIRQDIPDGDKRGRERRSSPGIRHACASSPLGKRHGWGVHRDDAGRIALVPLGSDEYRALAADSGVKQLKAMRSRRL